MFTKADSLSVFLCIVGCSIAVIFFDRPEQGAIVFIALFTMLAFDPGMSLARLFKSLPFVLLVPACLLAFHALGQPGTPVKGFILPVTQEGIEIGLVYFFRVAFVILVTLSFAWTCDIRELMVGLTRLGLPHRFAFVIYLALRFIPVMVEKREDILDSIATRQQSRPVNLKTRVQLLGRYLFLLIVSGVRMADQTAVAIQLRGFDPVGTRTYFTKSRTTVAGGLLLAFAGAGFGAVFLIFG